MPAGGADEEDSVGILQDKVALVTGASSGIGRGIARGLAHEGARVVLAARREAELRELEQELTTAGGQALAVVTDVTHEAQVEHLFGRTMEHFGRLDILFNNAGTRGPPRLRSRPLDHGRDAARRRRHHRTLTLQ